MTARVEQLQPIRTEIAELWSLTHLLSQRLDHPERLATITASSLRILKLVNKGVLAEREAYNLALRVRKGDLRLSKRLKKWKRPQSSLLPLHPHLYPRHRG